MSALAMTEAHLQRCVMDLCAALGLYVHHDRPARTAKGWRTAIEGKPGYPDLVIAGPHGVLYRELKSDRGVVSPDQVAWLKRLTAAGCDAAVWRPAAWPDLIHHELRMVA